MSTASGQSNPPSTQTGCPDCSACADAKCPEPPEIDGPRPSGGRFALASAGLFLVPLVLAIIGAFSLGSSPQLQLLGAVSGLAIGMAGAAGIAGIRRSTLGPAKLEEESAKLREDDKLREEE